MFSVRLSFRAGSFFFRSSVMQLFWCFSSCLPLCLCLDWKQTEMTGFRWGWPHNDQSNPQNNFQCKERKQNKTRVFLQTFYTVLQTIFQSIIVTCISVWFFRGTHCFLLFPFRYVLKINSRSPELTDILLMYTGDFKSLHCKLKTMTEI